MFQHDDDSLVGPGERLLRLVQVVDKTGLSRTTIYNRIADGTFPNARKISEGAVRWKQTEIERWINELPIADAGFSKDGRGRQKP